MKHVHIPATELTAPERAAIRPIEIGSALQAEAVDIRQDQPEAGQVSFRGKRAVAEGGSFDASLELGIIVYKIRCLNRAI